RVGLDQIGRSLENPALEFGALVCVPSFDVGALREGLGRQGDSGEQHRDDREERARFHGHMKMPRLARAATAKKPSFLVNKKRSWQEKLRARAAVN
ncbi:MAG: hypothetical protein ACKO39_07335, partial [Chthoniobacterales bacterium]